MARNIGRLLFWTSSAALLAAALGIAANPLDPLLFIAIGAVFTAPGWPLARWYAGDGADRVTRAILAVMLGYLAGATVFCAFRLVGFTSPLLILAGCGAVAAGLARVLRGPRPGLVSCVRLDARDRIGLGVLWLIALAIVGPVFARVGESTPTGLAYRAYFIADLFAHMSAVAELVKGATPPLDPYLPTTALPYYWTYFTLPTLFSQLRPALLIDRGILLTDTCMALGFVSVGFVVVRNLGTSALAAATSWSTILLASSFEGLYFMWDHAKKHLPLAGFRVTNIDALTRWFWDLPPVDGLHRAMWWTPQHEMALAFGMLVLLASVRPARRIQPARGLAEGWLLGGALAVSSFNGVLLVVWYGLTHVVDLIVDRGRDIWQWTVSRGLAAMVVAAYAGLMFGLGMLQSTPNSFILGWNRHFLRGPWRFLALSFGPALVLAPFGLAAVARASRRLAIAMGALVVVAAAMFLFVDLRGHENALMSFRTGHLFFVGLAIVLAFAIDAWRQWPRVLRAGAVALLVVGTAAAIPTVALDWYNARDISNVEMNPGGFPWTIYVSLDDQAAVRWIQQYVPVDATVQTDAQPRARNTWAFVAVFARRRMATGNGIYELNPSRFAPNLAAIHEAFHSADASAAHATFVRLGADYLYVGDVERQADGDGVRKFPQRPDLFKEVYRRGNVEVFKVLR